MIDGDRSCTGKVVAYRFLRAVFNGMFAGAHISGPVYIQLGESMPLSKEDAALMLAIGKRVRILRLTREWTQAELADFSGLSRAFLALMERGGHGVDVVRLSHLAKALNVPLSDLLPEESQRG